MPTRIFRAAPSKWRLLLALAAAPLAVAAAPAETLYAGINELRLHGCQTAAQSAAAPLTIAPVLEAAAQRRAGGETLPEAFAALGTPFANGVVLVVGGSPALALQRLAERHCDALRDTEFSHVGAAFLQDRWWIVLGGTPASGVAAAAGAAAPATTARAALVPDMLTSVNAARSQARRCGDKSFDAAPALAWNAQLAQAALTHAEDMARRSYFSHTSPEGASMASRATAAGYRYRAIGENIGAAPAGEMDAAMAEWLGSPGHCANIMNPGFAEIGAAVASPSGSSQGKWVQLFGRR